jgi:hypothetical protein
MVGVASSFGPGGTVCIKVGSGGSDGTVHSIVCCHLLICLFKFNFDHLNMNLTVWI